MRYFKGNTRMIDKIVGTLENGAYTGNKYITMLWSEDLKNMNQSFGYSRARCEMGCNSGSSTYTPFTIFSWIRSRSACRCAASSLAKNRRSAYDPGTRSSLAELPCSELMLARHTQPPTLLLQTASSYKMRGEKI